MNEKITISLPREQIITAKRFSKRTGRTLSGLIKVSLQKTLSNSSEVIQEEKRTELTDKGSKYLVE
jgi:hypothetical protein